MAVSARAYATGMVVKGSWLNPGKGHRHARRSGMERVPSCDGATAGFELRDMKRMKVTVEAIFEFPDDYGIAPDHDGVPSLKIGRKIFIPAIHWMEQAVFLESVIPGEFETEPSRGFEPADQDTNDTIMGYETIEDSLVEMAEDGDANRI